MFVQDVEAGELRLCSLHIRWQSLLSGSRLPRLDSSRRESQMGTKAYPIRKEVFSPSHADITEFKLILDRGVLGEIMRKIVEEAEALPSPSQSAIETPRPSQAPTLPSHSSYHTKPLSKPLGREPIGKRRTPRRRLLPATKSNPSVSTRGHPLLQAPNEQTQPTHSNSGHSPSRYDHHNM